MLLGGGRVIVESDIEIAGDFSVIEVNVLKSRLESSPFNTVMFAAENR